MSNKVLGRIAVVLSCLALIPSLVPGAVSMIGLLMSSAALLLSVFSVRSGRVFYFNAAGVLFLVGVFLINDALRLWYPMPMPLVSRVALYAICAVLGLLCVFSAKYLNNKYLRTR